MRYKAEQKNIKNKVKAKYDIIKINYKIAKDHNNKLIWLNAEVIMDLDPFL